MKLICSLVLFYVIQLAISLLGDHQLYLAAALQTWNNGELYIQIVNAN